MSTKKTNPWKRTQYHGGHVSAGEEKLHVAKAEKQRRQGQYASSEQISDNAEKPVPRTQERGIGNSFAMAVDHLMNNVKNVKEQGVEFTNPNVATIPSETLGRKFGKANQPESFNHKKKLFEK
jgi:hypothetical protein